MAMNRVDRRRKQDETAVKLTCEDLDGLLDLGAVPPVGSNRLETKRRRDRLDFTPKGGEARKVRVRDNAYPLNVRRGLFERLELFAAYLWLESAETRDVAARARKAFDIANAHRVRDYDKDDWDGVGQPLQRRDTRRAIDDDKVWRELNEFPGANHRLLGFASVPSCVNASVLAVHPTCVAKGLSECRETFSTLLITFRVRHEEAQSAHAVQCLSHRRERHEGCQPQSRDDLPRSHSITSSARSSSDEARSVRVPS